MIKFILILVLLTLSSCAGVKTSSYASSNLPLAKSGSMKWSDYYTGLYNSIETDNISNKGEILMLANEGIKMSLDYESGKITKEEFDYIQRNIKASATQLDGVATNTKRKAFADALKNAADNANAQSNAYRQNSQVPAYTPPPKNNIRCQSQNGYTDCTQY